MKVIPTRRLDQASLAYLTQVERTTGQGANGVFLPRPGRRAAPRLGQWVGLCLGLLLAAATLAATAFLDFDHVDPQSLARVQAFLLAAALGWTVARLLALLRPVYCSPLGHFVWVDGRQLWEVAPEAVKVLLLDDVREAHATHFANNDVYSHSEVFLRTRAGSETLTIPVRAQADQLVQFATSLRLTPRATDKSHLPQPAEVEATPDPGQRGMAGSLLPWGGAVLVASLALRSLPHLNEARRENSLYAATLAAAPGDEQPFQLYLRLHPEGRHADAVRTNFEDNLAQYAAASAPDERRRYEEYLQLFPQGRLTADVRTGYEAHLARAAQGDGPATEEHCRRYLEIFPTGRQVVAVRRALESNLYAATLAADLGDQRPYRRYLAEFPNGGQVDKVRSAFQDNLMRFALAAPPGEEQRYQDFLALFPDGACATRVRDSYEHNLHAHAKASRLGDETRYQRYLEVFPKGKFADAVKAVIDDNRFQQSRDVALAANHPAQLRVYLRDPSNQRHRREAQQHLDAIYNQEIDKLKKLAVDRRGKDDPELLESLLALLEALKRADSSLIRVGFKAVVKTTPEKEPFLSAEKESYNSFLDKFPELKALEKERGTAILPLGQVFDRRQAKVREEGLFERFNEAVHSVVRPELLCLVPAENAETPHIEIAYQIFASGNLWVEGQSRADDEGKEEKVAKVSSLVRCYHVVWVFRTLPPGADEAVELRFTTTPGERMSMRVQPEDPEWAPYGILMYVTFRNTSNRLRQALGLIEHPLPTSLSFRQALGK